MERAGIRLVAALLQYFHVHLLLRHPKDGRH